MYELYSWLIDKLTSLLAWLSSKQVSAAKARIRFCNHRIQKLQKTQGKISEKLDEYYNERIRMQYFLDSDSKEL